MTRILLHCWLALLLAGLSFLATAAAPRDTLVVIVRHAEKATDDPRDPSLSTAGQARAEALATVLAGLPLQAVYVSQFRRTQLTARPAASAAGLEPIVVEAGPGDVDAAARALAGRIRADHAGQAVLVVGHSNTVPALVAAFGGSAAAMPESEFDRLTLLSLDAAGQARVVVARY